MKRAFTIVELIVVISIIAMLSAAGILTYSNQQKRAREARRITDVGQISDAIQQYISLGNAVPTTAGAWSTTDPTGPLSVLVSTGLLADVPVERFNQGTSTRCQVYHYNAPTNNIATSVGPSGAVGIRQYAISFHSEVASAASQAHPMNASLVTLNNVGPATGCNYYSAFLLGPK
jgi:prepilin-type N-terminal cleavage/methylation domain-containing protein